MGRQESKLTPKPTGRPSLYTEELAEEICTRLAEGETLLQICKGEGFPDRVTVNRWQIKDESFASRIARARDIGQDSTVDECRDIADLATPEDVNVAKLRIWQRQWEASKRAPKRFGEKLDLNHSGSVAVKRVVSDL